MNVMEAATQIAEGVILGVRGVGCASIHMADGREYIVVSEVESPLRVERFSQTGDLVERQPASEIAGEVEEIVWRVDETGAITSPLPWSLVASGVGAGF